MSFTRRLGNPPHFIIFYAATISTLLYEIQSCRISKKCLNTAASIEVNLNRLTKKVSFAFFIKRMQKLFLLICNDTEA